MPEFLSENRLRAYPLEQPWPTTRTVSTGASAVTLPLSDLWTRLLCDASISVDAVPADGVRLALRGVAWTATALTLTFGLSSASTIAVTLTGGANAPATVFAKTAAYKVFLTVDPAVLSALLAELADEATALANRTTPVTDPKTLDVTIPVVLRCVSFATKRVDSVTAYSPTLCQTPLFTSSETAVREVTPATASDGSLLLKAADGVDLETVTLEPLEGQVLRISAITAPADTTAVKPDIDIMVRGDDCITVEAIPGAYVATGGVIRAYNEVGSPHATADKCGVLVIGTKCKPCCQCEDYADAVNTLRPYETRANTVKGVMDAAAGIYANAVRAYNTAKTAARAAVGSYDRIVASASAVTSAATYTGSNAAGTRSRLAVTLLVTNLTTETAKVRNVTFTVPGYPSETNPVKVQWATAGTAPTTGTSWTTSQEWTLQPGDALSLTATYAKTATANAGVRPDGLAVSFTATLPANTDLPSRPLTQTRTVTVT